MTNVIILGKPEGKKKPIKFTMHCYKSDFEETQDKPSDWENIELIALEFDNGFDLMYAYDNSSRSVGALYLGYFNDGIVK